MEPPEEALTVAVLAAPAMDMSPPELAVAVRASAVMASMSISEPEEVSNAAVLVVSMSILMSAPEFVLHCSEPQVSHSMLMSEPDEAVISASCPGTLTGAGTSSSAPELVLIRAT